jgi:hypothetical protein
MASGIRSKRLGALGAGLAAAAVVLFVFAGLVPAQQVHRNGFEGREVVWVKGATDALFSETLHDRTDQTAHAGQSSEHLQVTAEKGSFIYYEYPAGRAPVGEELSVSVWVKANRPGAQLLARLVLPHERNPKALDEPLTTLLRGDLYQQVGRWQRLELRRPTKLATDQQQMLRLELTRDVDFSDAYIDRLVLNVLGGPGFNEVWIDDLEIGPVVEAPSFQTTSRPVDRSRPDSPATSPRLPKRAAVVELNQSHLLVSGRPFLFRGIRHSDTPLKTLRDAGFNTIWVDYATAPGLLDEAVNLGFWLVPALPVTRGQAPQASPEDLGREVGRFLESDAVLFWDLGGALLTEDEAKVARTAQTVRAADPQRPLGADVWDGFRPYSRNLDLLGVHRWPLMTTLELTQYREWLNQRRLLARPGTFFWTWVQTHLPEWYMSLVYERDDSKGFDEPVGPQPEQIRLLTYLALAAGSRGLGFWSDRFLADSHQGRDRLQTLALLNQELQMLEPLLVTSDAPRWIGTSIPEVQAAVLRTERGVLVLPMWLGKGAQYVPGQSAAAWLSVVVPDVPAGTQAWRLSPGEVRTLKTERVAGGTKVTVPEFGLTTALLFTSDNGPTGFIVRCQNYAAHRNLKLAAQWSYDLAQGELDKVVKIHSLLEQAGHSVPDAAALLDNARERLRACLEHWNNEAYSEAYAEAQRAVRPLRILMRAEWEKAIRDLDTVGASPYAASYYTLPRHWEFLNQVKESTAGVNVLPDGDFEQSAPNGPATWVKQETTLDVVSCTAQRVKDQPQEGRQCLMLEIKPTDAKAAPSALERTFLAANSPVVRLQPGTLVRISGWVRIPEPIYLSPDGALLYDSIGGEPLAVRLTGKTAWKKFTLYRRVPASGAVNVTLALTGVGKVFFDDIRIEPLSSTTTAKGPSAGGPP